MLENKHIFWSCSHTKECRRRSNNDYSRSQQQLGISNANDDAKDSYNSPEIDDLI